MSKDGKVIIDIEADDSGFKSEIDELGDEAKEASKGFDDLGDSADKAGDGLSKVEEIAAGNILANALTAMTSSIANAAASLFSLSDSTREFRDDMAKLETAFGTAGHSTETASKAYEDFYAILGESDRSVEAVNHLAELTQNEEELAKWSDIAAGVTAKFGDSLPIEGLTEAANETAKVGKVTGPLADALNWAGISEDEFNEKLAACNSEQERAALITETLNKEYKAAADEYNDLTKETQAARRATSQMEKSQAKLGETVEPLTTAWTELKTKALDAITPVIEFIANKFEALTKWMNENKTAATIIKGVLIAVAAALGVLAAALGISSLINAVKTAFAGLNTTMLANPITLIVAAIAALVAAFIYLWNNCEEFREFWIGLWEGIKTAFSAVVEWIEGAAKDIAQFFTDAWETIKTVWSVVTEFFTGIWDGIKKVFSAVVDWFSGIFTDAWNGIKTAWATVTDFFTGIWDGIKLVFELVAGWFSQKFQAAKDAVVLVWDTVAGFFSGVWDGIKDVFKYVGGWFSQKFQDAKDAVKFVWDTVAGFFSGVWEDIKEAFDGVVDFFSNLFDDARKAIEKAWEGITDFFSGIWKGIKNAFSGSKEFWNDLGAQAGSMYDSAAAALEVNSPSKKFIYLSEMSVEGMGVGWEKELPKLEAEMQESLKGLTTRVQATVGAENARIGESIAARDTGLYDLSKAVGTQTAGINSLASEYRRGNTRPVILELNGRELGRAVVDVGSTEQTRVGTRLAVGLT